VRDQVSHPYSTTGLSTLKRSKIEVLKTLKSFYWACKDRHGRLEEKNIHFTLKTEAVRAFETLVTTTTLHGVTTQKMSTWKYSVLISKVIVPWIYVLLLILLMLCK
jgi:hypothetical protein